MKWDTFAGHLSHLPPGVHARIKQAYDLGEKAHAGQKRKSGEPYFTHPITVAQIIADMGGDADSIIVALLHDAVEDTPMTIEETGQRFGPAVQQLIDGLTKLSSQDIAQKPTVNDQVESLRKIFALTKTDVRIMVLKLADRLHNMRTIAALSPERQIEFARETMDVYVKFASKLCMQDVRDELEALCLAVLEPEMFAKLSAHRDNAAKRTPVLTKAIRTQLAENPSFQKVRVEYEFQTWDRQRVQVQAQGAAVTGIPGQTVAIVCESIDQCYGVLGALHQRWRQEILSFQDFINTPGTNGYRGLHTTILLEDGSRLRCKIRTEEMHAYARKGITHYCFDAKAQDALTYLPWLQRIAPLTADTKDRSQEFWDSLQNDILGDSMVVYSSDNRSASLPAGSTALDAAIHLYMERAMYLEAIKVNGQLVALRHSIGLGDSIECSFGETPTVSRDWLEWVGTSFAAAEIRTALVSLQSDTEREQAGRHMLQRVMHEGKKGFIEEFNEESLVSSLETIGYSSMHDVYLAIADGHLDPLDAYILLFDTKRSGQKKLCVFRLFLDPTNSELLEYVNTLESNRDSFREVRYRYRPSRRGGTLMLKMYLSSQEQNAVLSEFRVRGAVGLHLSFVNSRAKSVLGVGALILLWGLDPVLAHLMLNRLPISPLDLTFMRFLSFTLLSGLGLLWVSRRSHHAQVRLPIRDWFLWLSALLLLCVAATSYLSLQGTTPLRYTIPMTAAGVVLAGLRSRRKWTSLLSWVFTAAGIVVLVSLSSDWPLENVLLTLMAVISFCFFWIVSERYKHRERVAYRSGQHFFLICMLCLMFLLPLLPFTNLFSLSAWQVGLMLLFGVFVAGFPYFLTYFMLSQREIGAASVLSFAVIPVTLIAQTLTLEAVTSVEILSAAIVIAASLLLIERSSPSERSVGNPLPRS